MAAIESAAKCFHPNISGTNAEKLLLSKGRDGSFLVRPSQSQPGDYALSARRGDTVTHIKIQNSGDYYDLYGGEKFADLTELVQYYLENTDQLKEKNGTVIEIKHPLPSEDPTQERWYHGQLSGRESEKALRDRGTHGSFLVRESQSQPGRFVLTVRCKTEVTHIIIRNVDGNYDVGGGAQFRDLTSLVDHYRKNPIVEQSGNIVHLLHPFNATRLNAANIALRFDELSKETDAAFGKAGFWEEFGQLQAMEQRGGFTRHEGSRPENKHKNRYKNILPFDHTRVKLMDVGPEVGADYVNANYIDGEAEGSEKAYIASQGTMPDTLAAFWQMAFENNCRIIVMTTNTEERGKHKCTPYWPPSDKPVSYGKYTVKLISTQQHDGFVIRRLELSKGGQQKREVYQYQYIDWPDHGVPDERQFLSLILTIRQHNNMIKKAVRNPGPLLSHCSAGIGRTGTFLVIDIVLEAIEQKGKDILIDIQQTILRLREQRSGIIQTAAQYRFVYKAIKDHMDNLRALEAGRPVSTAPALYEEIRKKLTL